MKTTEFQRLLAQFTSGPDSIALMHGAVILGCIALAWLLGRYATAHTREANAAPTARSAARAQLSVPLIALLLMLAARAVLEHWHSAPLLNIAVALLVALIIIRFAVVMLRQVFAPSGWIEVSARFIGWAVLLGFALHITGLAPDILRALDELDFTIGKHRISLLLVLQGTLAILATMLVALWLGRFAEGRLMRAAKLDINLRVMLSKVVQALLIVAAVLITLPAIGVDLTVLSVFGGMLGVGIGFGLQKIASNYISGFIILMDRSVSIGDVITVDQHTGQLTKMTARYVVVRNLAGTEALIPNETIITSTVVNHSYSDRRVSVAVRVLLSYRADLDAAVEAMEEAARACPRVLPEPAPRVAIKTFGENGMELELGVWIEDPDAGPGIVRSDLYFEIWRRFKARGLDTAYPQREVRLLNATGSGPV
jgi:small-conductance mechanosensitive channel